MPYYDDYDPEEMRRRALFSNLGSPDVDDQEDFQVDTSAPPPATGIPGGTPYALEGTSRPMSFAEQTLFNMKAPEFQQPSGWARAGAALSGLGAGLLGRNGAEVANEALEAPYRRAQMGYKQALETAMRQVNLEHAMRGEETARRRAAAYEVGNQARMRAAEATERWRHAQELHELNKPYEWKPQNLEEAMKLRAAGKTPQQNAFEQYLKDPENFKEFRVAMNAGKQPALSLDDRMKLQENVARTRAKYRAPKETKPESPTMEAARERNVLNEMSRDPQFSPFIAMEKGKPRAKSREELPKGHFWNNVNDSLVQDNYNNFLSELAKRKRGGKAPTPKWEEVK